MSSNEQAIEALIEPMKGGDSDAWLSYFQIQYPEVFSGVGVQPLVDPSNITNSDQRISIRRFEFVPENKLGKQNYNIDRLAVMEVTSQTGVPNSAEVEVYTRNGTVILLDPSKDRLNDLLTSSKTRVDLPHEIVELRASGVQDAFTLGSEQ